MRPAARLLPWAFLLGGAAAGAAVLVAVAAGIETPKSIAFLVVAAAFGIVGVVVATRHPGNPIGWIFAGCGLYSALIVCADAYASWAYRGGPSLPVAPYAAWVSGWGWIPYIAVPLTVLFLLFPDGRLLSRRWAAALAAIGAGLLIAVAGLGLSSDPIEFGDGLTTDNPLAISGALPKALTAVGLGLLLAGAVASSASLVLRYRRTRGEQHEQLKWLVVSFVVLAAAIATAAALWGTVSWGFVPLTLGQLGIPLATGIAILKYRLYEIDRIISRTLVYGALTAILAGLYFGIVLALQAAFSSFTQGNELAVAGSTLAVAALFRPARSRIQALVDRRFYRSKVDAARTLEAFSARLRREIDLDTLAAELRSAAQETMQPAHLSLWVRSPEARP